MSITTHRLETAASQLLTALEYSLEFLNANDDGVDDISARIAVAIFAIAEAKAAGIEAQAAGAMVQIAERIRESHRALSERQEIAAGLLAACRMVVERWEHGDLAEAARACQDAIDAYEAASTGRAGEIRPALSFPIHRRRIVSYETIGRPP